ncbi:MAG: sulfatase-like hydrolase/transferase [Elusimicrobiota bacterium]
MSDRRVRTAARAALWAFCAATSLYCLLCHLPFAWTNFIADARYPAWVGILVRRHGLFAVAAAALGATALRGKARTAWGAIWGAAAVAAAAAGWLASRGNDGASLIWAFVAWAPYASWEAAVDRSSKTEPSGPSLSATAAVLAGVFSAAVYFADAAMRGALSGTDPFHALLGAAWSVLAHVALFLLAALVLDAIAAAFGTGPAARRTVRALLWVVSTKALAWALASISFSGPAAWGYAALTTAMMLWIPDAVSTAARGASAGLPRRLAAIAALIAAPWAVRAALGGQDWNRLFESLAAVGLWAFSAALFARILPPRDPARARRTLWAAGAVCAALILAAGAGVRRWSAALQLTGTDVVAAVRAYESADISLITARRIIRRVSADSEFYALLQENTNIPRGGSGRNLELVKNWPAVPGPKPHVFILVIDSLRSDYVGAYNSKVRFTPMIDAFARDAVLFRKAFTSYGGTGLSEPSIWTGARIHHEQYPQPFPPMNTLEKLIDRDGYRPLIAVDVVLTELLKPDKRENALDKESYPEYKFCRSVDALDERLDQELAAGKPLFVYTQPQDVHISEIQREGATAVSQSPDFNGFYAPYASRVARIDACFGRFVEDLKKRGIYDDSVVVLTSDHGDSLGEDGRWGHAYTLFPEILRVPLIIRAPKRLLEGRYWDADAAAFLTDVTPTLYALLGREPDAEGEPFGRPLFERDRETFVRRTRTERPVVSSYGPVYGLLRGNGRELYLADGVNYSTYLFDLEKDPAGTVNRADAASDAAGRAALRAELDALRRYYNY